jgi:hypothetical protein
MTKFYKTKNHASTIISRSDHMNMFTNPWLDHDTTNKIKNLTIVSTTQNNLKTKVKFQWYHGIKWNKERVQKEKPHKKTEIQCICIIEMYNKFYVYLNSKNKVIMNIFPWLKIGLNGHVLFKVSFKMQSLTNFWDFFFTTSNLHNIQ